MNRTIRTVLGALAGLFCFLLVGLDTLLFGIVPLHSPVLTVLPIVGLVLGALWARSAPLRVRRAQGGTP